MTVTSMRPETFLRSDMSVSQKVSPSFSAGRMSKGLIGFNVISLKILKRLSYELSMNGALTLRIKNKPLRREV